MSVADTILDQLGGNKFIAVTGISQVFGNGNILYLRLPKIARGEKGERITHFVVEYKPGPDSYTVRTIVQNVDARLAMKVAEYEDIYAEQLTTLFTQMTRLETRIL